METLICPLCLRSVEKNKIPESHIIPEFFFRNIYDKKHRFISVSNRQGGPSNLKQKGFTEKLLCSDCESKLSDWERCLKNTLSAIQGNHSNSIKISESFQNKKKYLRVGGIDYQKFKLAVLVASFL